MATKQDYVQYAIQQARAVGIDSGIFVRQIDRESGFDPTAHSAKGALGIAQFMPATAAGLGIDPWNPWQSLSAAARLDKSYLDRYGSYALMLAAYNAGPGNVDKYGGVPPFAETQTYIRDILGGAGVLVPSGANGAVLLVALVAFVWAVL